MKVRRAGWLAVTPAVSWLLLFYVIPTISMLAVSLQQGSLEQGFRLTWHWHTYIEVFDRYHVQLVRSVAYAGVATAACLLIAYPLAYTIAFRAGRYRNAVMFLVVLPFFVSLVIRTLSWKFVLADEGFVVHALRSLGASASFHVLSTPGAVIGGLVYNFLPFATLPLAVSLSRIDPLTLNAAGDLYASRWARFRTVTLPLSVPGLVAAAVLTFIPAAGDYVNATLLGGPSTTMIGNVIQRQFLVENDFPAAAALSFVLLGAILIAMIVAVVPSRSQELAA